MIFYNSVRYLITLAMNCALFDSITGAGLLNYGVSCQKQLLVSYITEQTDHVMFGSSVPGPSQYTWAKQLRLRIVKMAYVSFFYCIFLIFQLFNPAELATRKDNCKISIFTYFYPFIPPLMIFRSKYNAFHTNVPISAV